LAHTHAAPTALPGTAESSIPTPSPPAITAATATVTFHTAKKVLCKTLVVMLERDSDDFAAPDDERPLLASAVELPTVAS